MNYIVQRKAKRFLKAQFTAVNEQFENRFNIAMGEIVHFLEVPYRHCSKMTTSIAGHFCICLAILLFTGCKPSIPGVEIDPTPVTWQVPLTGNPDDFRDKLLYRSFDSNGNAYLLDTYLDTTAYKISYRLAKIDSNGTKLWHFVGSLDTSDARYEQIIKAKLLFDSANNIYIVGVINSYTPFSSTSINYALLSAKITSNGIYQWQNKQVVASDKTNELLNMSAVVNSQDALLVASLNSSVVNVFEFDALGSPRSVVSFDPRSAFNEQCQFLLRIDVNDNLVLFPRGAQFVQFSAAGQHLQTMPYEGGCIEDFIINPDGTITLFPQRAFTKLDTIRRYALSGTLVWETNISLIPTEECVLPQWGYYFSNAIRTNNGIVTILYDYRCIDFPQLGDNYERSGYKIVQLNELGEQIGQIERDVPVLSELSITSLQVYINGFVDANLQVDHLNNVFVMEEFARGRVSSFMGIISTNIYVTLLTRKYSPTGTLVKEIRSPEYRSYKANRKEDFEEKNGPFYVSPSGSLSLFIETKPSSSEYFKYMLVNHRSVF